MESTAASVTIARAGVLVYNPEPQSRLGGPPNHAFHTRRVLGKFESKYPNSEVQKLRRQKPLRVLYFRLELLKPYYLGTLILIVTSHDI